ncbi:hypothetical protein POM88_017360 [Heracleum sosnowskyi]|uniref:Transposase n=1 Tax=Heracleum sosnowskyi TaxID=360622 RepID=A0AAD8INJ5_9APIA|nr:hypothetical protein POM88_017360 [Heracleum sosnowskyi]
MHKNFRHLPSDDKDRVIEIIKKNGGTYADHRPSYINPDVWDTLCKYWDSEIFRKRSATGKGARKKVEVPHTSGATSFETRRRDYREKNDGNLDYTIVYKDCHTLKDEKRKGKWISKKAKRIMIRYKKICKNKGVDPKQTQIQSWVEAIGGSELRSPPPRKGEGGSGRREGPGTKGKAPMDEDDVGMEGGMDDGGDDMDDEEEDGMDDEDNHDDAGSDMDDEDDYDGGMGDYEDTESDEDRDLSSPPSQEIQQAAAPGLPNLRQKHHVVSTGFKELVTNVLRLNSVAS